VLYPLVAMADGLVSFALLLGAVGLFQGATVPGTSALIAASAPEGKHGSTFGMAASMQSLALMLGPLGGGLVTGIAGINAVYVVIGIFIFVTGIVSFLIIKEPRAFAKDHSSAAR
ncbi:MAG: MFS transporter, partial [Tepidiformaceae bacterium]